MAGFLHCIFKEMYSPTLTSLPSKSMCVPAVRRDAPTARIASLFLRFLHSLIPKKLEFNQLFKLLVV